MKINFLSIKTSERLSVNEYVLTTTENDLIHVALQPGDCAKLNLSIRINGVSWHRAEIEESDCAMLRAIQEFHFNQEDKKAKELRERARKVAASVFSL